MLTSLSLAKPNGTDHTTFMMVGSSNKGAMYKDATRSLALPLTLEVAVTTGNPGAKGNDHVKVKIASSVAGAGTSVPVVTGSVTLDISLPRDANWTDTHALDILSYLRDYLENANIAFLVDAIVP